MKALEPFIIFGGCIITGLICAAVTAAFYTRRIKGLYNRGWNAGREFALRNLHDSISR